MTSANHPNTPLVFFGTDAFSVPSLIALISGGWNVVAVVTKPDAPTGRGRIMTPPAVKRLAEASGIPVLQPERLGDFAKQLEATGAEAGIVVAYGKVIPPSVLSVFSKGLINVHASLLPRYRGASPIEAAILAGDDETGVTLMQLEAGLDTGPTYDVTKLQLDGTETRESLYERLAELGADLLTIRLGAILDGEVIAIPQDESAASTVGRIQKADGLLDWAKPADVLAREVRAYLGWPGSRTHLAGTELTVTAAHVTEATGPSGSAFKTASGDLAVNTRIGALVLDSVKPAGKREMPGRDFLAGHAL